MNAHGDGATSGSGSNTLVVGKTTDDDLVDQAIVHLRRIWSEGLLKTVVAMGNYLIQTFYGGSLVEAQSRSPQKPAALARLYERADDLPVSVHALKQCVRIASQYQELPRPLADGLSKAHHEALLSVADPKKKLELAQEAAERHLSSRELVARINAEEQQRTRGGGRPPLPRVVRRLSAVLRVFDAPGFDDEIVPAALQALAPAELERMREQVRRVHKYLNRMAQALGTRHVEVGHVSTEAIDRLLLDVDMDETREPTTDTCALREDIDSATVPPLPWGQLMENPVQVANPRAAELLAMMPGDDSDDEGLATWLVDAVDVLATPELAVVLMPHRERVKALTGKMMKGYEDRRVRMRLRHLVQKMEALRTTGERE